MRTPQRVIPCALAALGLGAVAVPAAANAATVRADRGVVVHQAISGERNDVRAVFEGRDFVVTDRAGLTAGPGCRAVTFVKALCGTVVGAFETRTLDRDDRVTIDAVPTTLVDAGAGNDLLFAGRVPGVSRITWRGGAGTDTISYATSSRGVRVSKNGRADDGRSGDLDNVAGDVERIDGTAFDDVLIGGGTGTEVYDGFRGDDVMIGLDGADHFHQGNAPDGADSIAGGEGGDIVFYDRRQEGVSVSLDGVANDGRPGERDNVSRDTDSVFGTPASDKFIGTGATNAFHAGAGNDRIDGKGNPTGRFDGDKIFCGPGHDQAARYSGDLLDACEPVFGPVRVTP